MALTWKHCEICKADFETASDTCPNHTGHALKLIVPQPVVEAIHVAVKKTGLIDPDVVIKHIKKIIHPKKVPVSKKAVKSKKKM